MYCNAKNVQKYLGLVIVVSKSFFEFVSDAQLALVKTLCVDISFCVNQLQYPSCQLSLETCKMLEYLRELNLYHRYFTRLS